jgi:hypothetical protein
MDKKSKKIWALVVGLDPAKAADESTLIQRHVQLIASTADVKVLTGAVY